MKTTRGAQIKITYEGRNITADIAPYLVSFTYTDNSGGTSDDISISVEDRAGLWVNDWRPAKGDKIQATISTETGTGIKTLPCGTYEVDEISYSRPPGVMSIKAVSCAVSRTLAGEKHSRAWENANISEIARDFAAKGNLALYYDVDEDISIERREQIMQSDLEFLRTVCADYDLNVKVSDGKLIIYSGEKYEDRGSAATLSVTDERLESVKFTSRSAKTYKKARVKYHHPVKNKTFSGEYEDEGAEGTGRTLVINEYAESEKDAGRIAKKRLKQANAREVTGTLTMLGEVSIAAGVNITLEGFGMFSGKYMVVKATHSVTSSGYTTSVELQQGLKSKLKAKKKKKKKSGAVLQYYTGDKYYHQG